MEWSPDSSSRPIMSSWTRVYLWELEVRDSIRLKARYQMLEDYYDNEDGDDYDGTKLVKQSASY